MRGNKEEKRTLASVLKNKGNEYLSGGRALEALDLYNQAVVLDPKNHLIYSNRCAALIHLEEYQEALQDADRVLKLMPGWPMGYYRRGTALVYMKRYQEAEETYQQGLGYLPDNAQLREGLDHCTHQIMLQKQQQQQQQKQQQQNQKQQQEHHQKHQQQQQQSETPEPQAKQNMEQDNEVEEDEEEDLNSMSSLDDLCDELMLETEVQDSSYCTSIADELALAKDRKDSCCIEENEDKAKKTDLEYKSKQVKNIKNQQMLSNETDIHKGIVSADANESVDIEKNGSREIVQDKPIISSSKQHKDINPHHNDFVNKDDAEKNEESDEKSRSKYEFEDEKTGVGGTEILTAVTLDNKNVKEKSSIYKTDRKVDEYNKSIQKETKSVNEVKNGKHVNFDIGSQYTDNEIIQKSVKSGNHESLKPISHEEIESKLKKTQIKENTNELFYETDNESIEELNENLSRKLRVRNAVGIMSTPFGIVGSLFNMLLLIYRMLLLVGDIVKLILVSLYLTALKIYQIWSPPHPKSVLGDVVLITGAGHGIGKELALQYAQLGAKVVCWDINQVNNSSTVREIKNSGGVAWGYKCDVSHREDVRAAAQRVRDEIGDVTILINNVGIMPCKPFLKHTPEDIENIYRTNVFAHFWTVREFLPSMIATGHGHVVAMSSVGGMMGISNVVPYCSTSFAVKGLMEGLVEELRYAGRNPNIKLTCVLPSVVDTGLVQKPRIRFPKITPIISPADAAALIIQGQRLNFETICMPPKYYYAHAVSRLLPTKVRKTMIDFINTGVDEITT